VQAPGPGLTQRDIAAMLAALALTPVLMVTGSNDVIAPPRRAVAVATELRRCMLKVGRCRLNRSNLC
jgi:hypothetical protein